MIFKTEILCLRRRTLEMRRWTMLLGCIQVCFSFDVSRAMLWVLDSTMNVSAPAHRLGCFWVAGLFLIPCFYPVSQEKSWVRLSPRQKAGKEKASFSDQLVFFFFPITTALGHVLFKKILKIDLIVDSIVESLLDLILLQQKPATTVKGKKKGKERFLGHVLFDE